MVNFSSTIGGFVLASHPSTFGPTFKRSVLDNDAVTKILRTVPESEGFHFYSAIGKPTGESAVSLVDFVEKLTSVDLQSVNFHYPRKDFEKWIREVFGDPELAVRLSRIGRMHMGTQGEALRNEITRTVKVRLNELKAAL
jgi:hypothetical protein